uniref:phage minor capsid protein n=1 Tax=Adlercreutzia caecimuris TaxID=671266 RepID=UPI00272A6F21
EGVAAAYRQVEAEMLDYLVRKMIEGDVAGQRAQTAINLLAQSMPEDLRRIIDERSAEIDEEAAGEVSSILARSDSLDLAAIGAALSAEALTAQTAAVEAAAKRALRADNLSMSDAARAKFVQWSSWAMTQTATGNMTRDEALRRAVRGLCADGLPVPFVTYAGEDGSVTVRNRIDVAVQRHIRTAIAQGAAELTMLRIREGGFEFVEVSSHCGSRPSHAEWQGRCYHLGGAVEVDGERYEDFHFGTGYEGECGPYAKLGDRLLGVNCRHSFAPWKPGMSRAFEPDPESPTGLPGEELYRLSQRQRLLERRIRDAKRELKGAQLLYDADPSPENAASLTAAKALLRRRQEAMREFIAGANAGCRPGTKAVKRQPGREWAGDMPKITSGRVDKARMLRGTAETSQAEIDSIVAGELSGIRFSAVPAYNARIGSPGMTDVGYNGNGEKIIVRMCIGKQYRPGRTELIDTIVHEELEARIWLNRHGSERYFELNDAADDVRHAYIQRIIDRYMRLKGLK